jgi:alkanesulfonate monooxygenase SsuD/methylene tetrahydromethanopterin reductase-like flavin-dependent oxidoreductase (luciferase family)
MKTGVIITGGPAGEQVALARAADDAGWDGVFTFDGIHVGDDIEIHDPFALLSAFAVATHRVRLGAIVHPLARRRPWEVARQATTVDRLSGGRLVLPVGLGAADDAGFGRVGEVTDRRVRAERLDESLEVLTGLWSGKPFGYEGRHYRFESMAFRPTPVQQPRIPIWVVGLWGSERSMRRVARYDGYLPNLPADQGGGPGAEVPVGTVRAMRDWLAEHGGGRPVDLIIEGSTPSDNPAAATDHVSPLAEAGATWWIEAHWQTMGDVAALHARIDAGPPQVGP